MARLTFENSHVSLPAGVDSRAYVGLGAAKNPVPVHGKLEDINQCHAEAKSSKSARQA